MKKEYDFSKGKRGAAIPTPGMTRITIHIENDILNWFRARIEKACGGSYVADINDALRAFIDSKDGQAEENFHGGDPAASGKKTTRKKRAPRQR